MKTGRTNSAASGARKCAEAEKQNKMLLRYIRDRMNQLLLVMGTKPLKDRELSSDSVIAVDPIGIIAESFKQVLENLQESNRQLRDAKDYLQAVFDTAGVCISIVDRDLKILKCNEMQKELLAKGTTRIKGRHCYEVYCGIDSPPLNCPVIETLETGRTVFIKEVTKKGRVFQIVTSPLKDGRGSIRSVIEISMDITEKKKAEDAARQSERLASIGQLAAGIAHEINNPLGNILGYAKLLLRDGSVSLTEAQRGKLEIIAEQAQVGSKIVRGLLDFSHQKKPVFERISLNATIEKAAGYLESKMDIREAKIVKKLAPLPKVPADPNQMEQVVFNIVLNAIHAMEGRSGTIEIKTRACDHEVEFSVKDSGIGIPGEHLGKIFDPFFTTKPVGKGTGLGLSICSGIIKEHGGSIRVESRTGEGTTFYVRIPKRRLSPCRGAE
ncbi:MAG TPA: ATP-binding protein [Dissulfurispiraceae bacterium]